MLYVEVIEAAESIRMKDVNATDVVTHTSVPAGSHFAMRFKHNEDLNAQRFVLLVGQREMGDTSTLSSTRSWPQYEEKVIYRFTSCPA
eukprot:529554-Amphidinium_carterae.1